MSPERGTSARRRRALEALTEHVSASDAVVPPRAGGQAGRPPHSVVFVWGMAMSCWDARDVVARRLAAVQLVVTRAATQVEVGAGFGAGEATVQRWMAALRRDGMGGLVPARKGPRSPIDQVGPPEVVDDAGLGHPRVGSRSLWANAR